MFELGFSFCFNDFIPTQRFNRLGVRVTSRYSQENNQYMYYLNDSDKALTITEFQIKSKQLEQNEELKYCKQVAEFIGIDKYIEPCNDDEYINKFKNLYFQKVGVLRKIILMSDKFPAIKSILNTLYKIFTRNILYNGVDRMASCDGMCSAVSISGTHHSIIGKFVSYENQYIASNFCLFILYYTSHMENIREGYPEFSKYIGLMCNLIEIMLSWSIRSTPIGSLQLISSGYKFTKYKQNCKSYAKYACINRKGCALHLYE